MYDYDDLFDLPIRYPINDGYWDQYDIAQTADMIEILATRIYMLAERELANQTEWNDRALSNLYDVVQAAQFYSSAVQQSRNVYTDTLNELFNLEETINVAASQILCGPISRQLRDNFANMKYYVSELLWQYRIDPTYADARGRMSAVGQQKLQANVQLQVAMANESLIEQNFENILTCQNYNFRWSKPHYDAVWNVAADNDRVMASALTIQGRGLLGHKGKTGIAGISQLVVTYTDGRAENLIVTAKLNRDPHVAKNGSLKLVSDADRIVIPLDLRRAVESVYVKADSWVSLREDVALSFALIATGGPSRRLP
jgi:hypothetical protein